MASIYCDTPHGNTLLGTLTCTTALLQHLAAAAGAHSGVATGGDTIAGCETFIELPQPHDTVATRATTPQLPGELPQQPIILVSYKISYNKLGRCR